MGFPLLLCKLWSILLNVFLEFIWDSHYCFLNGAIIIDWFHICKQIHFLHVSMDLNLAMMSYFVSLRGGGRGGCLIRLVVGSR